MCSTICTFCIFTSEYPLPTLSHVEHMMVMVTVMMVVVVVTLLMARVVMVVVVVTLMMVMVMMMGIVVLILMVSPVSILSPPSTTWNTLSTALVGV